MTPTANPTMQQLEVAQRLRTVFARAARSLRPTDTGSGQELTPTRASVLLLTDRHGPIRLAEIAEREGLNPTLLSRTIAHLVDSGLVERTADFEDRRSAWVRATTAGHAVADGVRRERTAHVEHALGRLTADERETIVDALPAIERLGEALREISGMDWSEPR